MHRAIRDYAGPLFTIITVLLAALSAFAIFAPNMRELLKSAWVLGWIGLVVVTIAACLIWYSQDGAMQKLEDQNTQQRITLGEHASCTGDLRALESERDDLRRDLEAARTQVRALQKPVPTARDQALFARLTAEWSWGTGTLFWLRDNFNSKSWGYDTPSQLIAFVDLEGELYFEDRSVNKAFEDFRAACTDLVDWLVRESSPSDHNVEMQVVHDETYRRGGYTEYLEVRQNGEKLAVHVVDAWRRFERVGRSHTL